MACRYVPMVAAAGANVVLGGLQIQSQYNPPTVSIQQTGLGQSFSIMPPFQAVTTIIATTGIWPEQPS